jgi:hypothetical protein
MNTICQDQPVTFEDGLIWRLTLQLIGQIAEEWMKSHPIPISGGVAVSRGRP